MKQFFTSPVVLVDGTGRIGTKTEVTVMEV